MSSEESEHAAVVLEWERRNSPDFDKGIQEFLYLRRQYHGSGFGRRA